MLNPNGLSFGVSGVAIFVVAYDPNIAVLEPNPSPSVVGKNQSLPQAALGSLALRTDVPTLYLKTAAADYAHPTGVWTQK